MAQAKRIKRTHKFQLDIAKEVEAWLDEWIITLKRKKKFSQYIRDGLTIMIYLAEWGIAADSLIEMLRQMREGSKNKMHEMFPHLQEDSTPAPVAVDPTPTTTPDIDELKNTIRDLTEMVTALTRTGGYTMQSTQPAAGQGMKKIASPNFALPTFEDEDQETQPAIMVAKSKNNDSAQNFVSALRSMQ